MAATLELKYFNSFWLKKLDSIVNVSNTVGSIIDDVIYSNIIILDPINLSVSVGQTLDWEGKLDTQNPTVVYTDGTTIILSENVTIIAPKDIIFGPITDFNHIPVAYEDGPTDWYIEESRIRGGYDNTDVDLGVKAYIVENSLAQQHLASSMIYSGIFNSRTGVNNTNQFSVAEDITRAVEPSQGTIQKLYAEDTNLIIFQEKKVSRALIDKDAIYSAEGQPMTTSGAQVIGQIQSYAGNYGISNNPESFAVYGYRKYFTDRTKNAVLRLSQDGITEISAYGMLDYFRDNLSSVSNSGFVVGGWDMHNKQYILSMHFPSKGRYETLAFDEDTKGWVSRYTYKPEVIKSLRNETFTFKEGNVWRHYINSVYRGSFYGTVYNSNIAFVFNPEVSGCKTFNTINYEGTNGWQTFNLITDTDRAVNIIYSTQANTLANLETQIAINNFKKKENKYFANIVNNTTAGAGDVIFGQSISGVKGYYANVSMLINNSIFGAPNSRNELFAVSLGYVESSY